eukprot:UN09690
MTEEYGVTWLSLVENCASVAASQGCVQIAIFLAHFACGLTAPTCFEGCATTAGECRWLLGRCRGSRVTIVPHHGSNTCSGFSRLSASSIAFWWQLW